MAYNPYDPYNQGIGTLDLGNFGLQQPEENMTVAEAINYGVLPQAQDTFAPDFPMGAKMNYGVKEFMKNNPTPTKASFVEALERGDFGGATGGMFDKNVGTLFEGVPLDASFFSTEMGDVNPQFISPEGSFGGTIDIRKDQLANPEDLPGGFFKSVGDQSSLGLPANDKYAMAISNYEELFGPKTMTDANQSLYTGTMDQSGFPVNYIDRIRQQNLPGFAYEPKESLINRIGSQLGNVKTTLGDAWGKTKEIGTRFKERAAPVFGLASIIANATNPRNPKAFNYNPELVGQLNFIDQQFPGMMINNPSSGLLQYAPGTPLQGQNVMSAFGSNDPIAKLEKQMAKHQKTIDKITDMWSKLKGQNIDPETGLDDLGRKIAIHKNKFDKTKKLHTQLLDNKKARIAERAQAERDFVTQGLGVTAADAATSGRGMDHTRGMTSRERGKAAARMGSGSRQAKSGSQKDGGSGITDKGWGWAHGGPVGVASMFTRRR